VHTEQVFDAIVIGAGAMGSATAYHLTRRKQTTGSRVLLLEQFDIGHVMGSSHGESRIFRYAYTQPAYSRLAMQCKPLWQLLEQEAGLELLKPVGGVDLADDEIGLKEIAAVASVLQSLGVRYEDLSASGLQAKFPQWRVPEQTRALYSPDTSFIWASRAVQVMVSLAAVQGAVVRDREAVLQVIPYTDGVEVITTKDTYRARSVVMTAGSWINSILKPMQVELPLRIEQEQLHYVAPVQPELFGPGRFTIWLQYGGNNAYGFPVLGSDGYPKGIKCGFHHNRRYIEPGDTDRTPSLEVEARMLAFLRAYLPDAAGTVLSRTCCLYTNTPDEDFVLDHVPGFPHVLLASPCSGHGFKFSIGIGKALADLAQHGQTDISIGEFGMARFASLNARE